MPIVIQTGNVCRVIPPVEIHPRNGTVEWVNRTAQRITVFVRAGIFDVGPTMLDIKPNTSETDTVREDAPYGLFPYSIYCHATNNNAIGSSDPEIIIEG